MPVPLFSPNFIVVLYLKLPEPDPTNVVKPVLPATVLLNKPMLPVAGIKLTAPAPETVMFLLLATDWGAA